MIRKRYKYIRNFIPEVPYDAGQAYLDKPDIWPILSLLRKMNQAGKLTPQQAYFFKSEKEPEQLFDLEDDPWELKNLADSPKYHKIKDELEQSLYGWMEAMKDKDVPKDASGKWKPVAQIRTPSQ